MKIEIDTVKKEIVVHQATAEEMLVTLKDYLGYTVTSKLVHDGSFVYTSPTYTSPPYIPPVGPCDPITPFWVTGSIHPGDIVNKTTFE